MAIKDRLSQLVKYKELTPRAFALKIGTSSQVFGNYLTGRDPSFEVVCKIIETFDDISPDWLLTGKGPMLRDERPPQAPSAAPPPPQQATDPGREALYIEVIAAKDDQIATQKELIAALKRERVSDPLGLTSARSVDVPPASGTNPVR